MLKTVRNNPILKGRSIYEASLILGFAFFITTSLTKNEGLAQGFRQIEELTKAQGTICYFSPTAEYPGGFKKWKEFIEKNSNFPYVTNPRSAATILGFKVLANGNINSVNVIRSSNQEIDAESVRLLKLSGPWKPATFENKAIGCRMSVRIIPYHSKKD